MVARNAHLNLNALGAEVLACVPDMYGDTDSPLHGDLGTDRLLAFWELDGERAREAISGDRRVDFTPFARAPEVGRPDGPEDDAAPDFPEVERVRLEIPPDLEELRQEDPDLLERWRERTRAAFTHYLERGYGVAALWRPPGTDRSAYCLESPEAGRRLGRSSSDAWRPRHGS